MSFLIIVYFGELSACAQYASQYGQKAALFCCCFYCWFYFLSFVSFNFFLYIVLLLLTHQTLYAAKIIYFFIQFFCERSTSSLAALHKRSKQKKSNQHLYKLIHTFVLVYRANIGIYYRFLYITLLVQVFVCLFIH